MEFCKGRPFVTPKHFESFEWRLQTMDDLRALVVLPRVESSWWMTFKVHWDLEMANVFGNEWPREFYQLMIMLREFWEDGHDKVMLDFM